MSPLLLKIPFGPTLWTNAAFISFHFSCLSLVFFLIFSCCVSTWLLRNLFIQSILLAPSFPRIKSSNISAICPFSFGSVFYKLKRDLITFRIFVWLHFGYYFPDFIPSERCCHLCWCCGSYRLLIFEENLFEIFCNYLILLFWIGS